MFRARIAVLAAAVAVVLGPPARAQLSPVGDAVTLDELVVTARVGPPIWTVSDGDTDVYILASPGWLPAGLAFDTSRIERRMAKANSLILSPRWADRAFTAKAVKATLRPPRGGAGPEASLAEPLRSRYVAARNRLGFPEARFVGLSPALAGMLMAGEVESARRPTTGASVDRVVWTIAKRHRVPVIRPARLYERRDADTFLAELKRPGLSCVEASLDFIERPPADDSARQLAAATAWAAGDIRPLIDRSRDVNAQRYAYSRHVFDGQAYALRMPAPDCSTAMPALIAASRQWVPDQTAAIEAALGKAGHAFAVLDPLSLVMQDGVLDQLRRKGYRVSTPGEDAGS